MKKSITLLALILTVSTAVFAKASADEVISITPLTNALGVGVSVSADAGKSMVRFYDNENTLQFKDKLTKSGSASKTYLLNELETGNYTMEVTTKNQVVKKQIRVYDEDGKKTYFIFQ